MNEPDIYALSDAARNGDTQALAALQSEAGQGNADAQYLIGFLYDQGKCVKGDCEEALKWWHKAADQGHVRAQVQIGIYYCEGFVKQDYAEALKWFRKAADQEYHFAKYKIGEMHARGQGVNLDYTEALKWFREASAQGDAMAQRALGKMFSEGIGVQQNWAEAYFWWNLPTVRDLTSEEVSEISKHLTPEQKSAVDKRVVEWEKDHPVPSSKP